MEDEEKGRKKEEKGKIRGIWKQEQRGKGRGIVM